MRANCSVACSNLASPREMIYRGKLDYLFPQLQQLQIACDTHTNNHVTSLESPALKLNYSRMKVGSYKPISSLAALTRDCCS